MAEAIDGMTYQLPERASKINEEINTSIEQRMKAASDMGQMVIDQIAEASKMIEAARDAEDHGMPAQEWIAFLNIQAILSDLHNARSAMKNAQPYSICPVCGGAGCAMCRGKGWVSAQQYKLIPKAQREGGAA